MNIRDAHRSGNASVSSQHMIAVLGRLQNQAVNAISGSIYIYDLVDQCTLCASCSVAAMLGYSAEAIHATGSSGLARLIHPADLNRVSEYYQRFTTLTPGEIITIEYRMKRADGTWCWLRSQETLLVQASDGLPLQIIGMLQDLDSLSRSNIRSFTKSNRSFRRHRSVLRTRVVCAKPKQQPMSEATN
ncbi:MAG: PAS domain-containing protein [Leptolyngbyaceae cyanobacterium SL_5_9]|nr:PAS domain-containing protein [Leptolyngbyaceae cyanobacterium SL_5_9]